MIRSAWALELLLAAGWLLLALWLGWIFGGSAGGWISAGLIGGISRHLYQMHRLESWLRTGRRRQPPQSWGIWGEVFEHYYKLQRRYTRRKKRLASVIREFRESTAAMPDGTVVLDRELRIAWFNSAAVKLLQLAGNSDIGQPVTSLLRAPAFHAFIRDGDFSRPVDIDPPGDASGRLSIRIVPYGSGQYLMLVRDVTRVRRLENMRRDFVANASHELRSPLTVLGGYLEGMVDDPEIPPVWAPPLTEMKVQCERMTQLVNDLLELSRLETDDPGTPDARPVGVDDLVRRICSEARSQVGDQKIIETDVDSTFGLVGNERELYSAFSNLVFNAVRYTDVGGKIRVRWYRANDGSGRFCVSDDGIGIDAKHLPFITQRFYRVDPSRSRSAGGTGLGLAIVKHVLQRHHARLRVRSELGEGSEFCCVFPASRLRGTEAAESIRTGT